MMMQTIGHAMRACFAPAAYEAGSQCEWPNNARRAEEMALEA